MYKEIKLNCGVSVVIEGFKFGLTYGGLLSGLPTTERINRSIFERIEHPWGFNKNTVKIPPTESEFKSEMKFGHYAVWLTSDELVGNGELDDHGSSLILVWIDDIHQDKTIEEIVLQGTKDIDWKKVAKDYSD